MSPISHWGILTKPPHLLSSFTCYYYKVKNKQNRISLHNLYIDIKILKMRYIKGIQQTDFSFSNLDSFLTHDLVQKKLPTHLIGL